VLFRSSLLEVVPAKARDINVTAFELGFAEVGKARS
jgi:hypothetical protein